MLGGPSCGRDSRPVTRAETRLDQVAAGRGIPCDHLARHPGAGTVEEHAGVVDGIKGDAAGGRDGAIDRGQAVDRDRHSLGEVGDRRRLGRQPVAGGVAARATSTGLSPPSGARSTRSPSAAAIDETVASASASRSGCRSISSPCPLWFGTQRVDRAAFQAGCGDRRFASNGATSGSECGVLDRHPSKRSRSGADQATSRPAFDAANGTTGIPAVSTWANHEPSPPTDGQLAPPRASTVAPSSVKPAHVSRSHRNAETGEPSRPSPQQTSGSHRGGKHSARRADECVGTEFISPRTHGVGRKRPDRGSEHRSPVAVTAEEHLQRLRACG